MGGWVGGCLPRAAMGTRRWGHADGDAPAGCRAVGGMLEQDLRCWVFSGGLSVGARTSGNDGGCPDGITTACVGTRRSPGGCSPPAPHLCSALGSSRVGPSGLGGDGGGQTPRISRKVPNMELALLYFCPLMVAGEETSWLAWSWSSSTHDTSKGAKQAVGTAS